MMHSIKFNLSETLSRETCSIIAGIYLIFSNHADIIP